MKALLLLGYITVSCGTIFNPAVTVAQTDSDTLPPQLNPPLSATQAEVAPLVLSVSKLLAQKSYQVESLMEINGDIPGTFFKSQAQVNTTVEAPNRVKSEINFISPNGLQGKKYQVVADGDQVWIYNLATNQYSVVDYQQFIQSKDGFLLGTLSYFYLKTLNDVGKSKIAVNTIAKLPADRLLVYFQRVTGIDLQKTVIRNENREGTSYKVYDISSTTKKFQLSTYVNSQQGDLERVHLSGNKDGLDLAVQEKVINQTVPKSIPADAFSFIPPNGAKQIVSPIAIEPF